MEGASDWTDCYEAAREEDEKKGEKRRRLSDAATRCRLASLKRNYTALQFHARARRTHDRPHQAPQTLRKHACILLRALHLVRQLDAPSRPGAYSPSTDTPVILSNVDTQNTQSGTIVRHRKSVRKTDPFFKPHRLTLFALVKRPCSQPF